MKVDPIFVDQAKLGEASSQLRACNFDLPLALGLQGSDRALEVGPDEGGIGAD